MYPVLLVLVACWEPSETGPRGLVGALVDHDSAPVVGQLIESVEAQAVTDARGHFTVEWKDPVFAAHFTRGGVYFRRVLQPGDGGRVTLRLPATAPLRLDCRQQTSEVVLQWALAPGFSGQVTHRCDRNTLLTIDGAPTGEPTVSTRVKGSVDLEPAPFTIVDGALALQPPRRQVRIDLRVDDARLNDACQVVGRDALGEVNVTAVEQGGFAGSFSGEGQLHASCAGRPIWPVVVPADALSVAVEWTGAGPVIDAMPVAPWASWLIVANHDQLAVLVVPAQDGQFMLPPLDVGHYTLTMTALDGERASLVGRPGRISGDVIRLTGPAGGPLAGDFELRESLVDGRFGLVE